MMKDMQTKINNSGFSMIEVLIAVTIISIVLLAIGALGSIVVNGMALTQRKREAESSAAAAVSKVKSDRRINLPEGGAFAVNVQSGKPLRNDEAEVSLNCTPAYCDRVITISGTEEGVNPEERVIGYDEPLPDGGRNKFVRAWAVADEDATRNWRRLTVAVFPTGSSIPITYSVTGGVIR